jgi:hypothetical protein
MDYNSMQLNFKIFSCVGVTIMWSFGLDDWIAPYTFTQFGTIDSYSAITILHNLKFTVAHTRILSLH